MFRAVKKFNIWSTLCTLKSYVVLNMLLYASKEQRFASQNTASIMDIYFI